MSNIQSQTSKNTTARLKKTTKIKAERAKLVFKFSTLEEAIDTFILFGIKAYREQLQQSKELKEN